MLNFVTVVVLYCLHQENPEVKYFGLKQSFYPYLIEHMCLLNVLVRGNTSFYQCLASIADLLQLGIRSSTGKNVFKMPSATAAISLQEPTAPEEKVKYLPRNPPDHVMPTKHALQSLINHPATIELPATRIVYCKFRG